MRVLAHIAGRNPKDKKTIATELFYDISYDYDDQVPDDSNYYLLQLGELSNNPVEAAELVLGADDPNAIINEAKIWNERIDTAFQNALTAILKQNVPAYKSGIKKWHTTNLSIYELSNTAKAADDSFVPMADYMTFVGEYRYLKPLLDDDVLNDIVANPQNYALLSVYPK